MVAFRPHTLRIIRKSGSYDSRGDWVSGGEEASKPVSCRYEPNGSARTITLPDGKAYAYSFTVYLNTDCPDILYGDTVELFDQQGNSHGRYEVRGFHRGQLDAKVWV